MRVLLFFAVCLLTVNSYGSDILFLEKSNTDALSLATKMDRPFFVFFCGRWCPTCKVMEEHTFTDDEVAGFASQNFLAFKANIDTPEGKEWKERYGVYAVPTIIFFDKYGNQKDLYASTMNAVRFMNAMRQNVDLNAGFATSPPIATTEPAAISSQFNNIITPSSSGSPTTSPTTSQPSPQSVMAAVQANTIETPASNTAASRSLVQSDLPTAADVNKAQMVSAGLKQNELSAQKKEVEKQQVNKVKEVIAVNSTEVIQSSNKIQPAQIQQDLDALNSTNQGNVIAAIPTPETSDKILSAPKKKRKKSKRKLKKERQQEILAELTMQEVEVPKVNTPKINVPTNSIIDTTPNIETNSNTTIPSMATETVTTTAPQVSEASEKPKKLERPKRKTLVLNPKKEVAPINIVIKTERTPSTSIPTTTTIEPVAASPTNVVSMANNSPDNSAVTPVNTTGTASYLQLGYFENHSNASVLANKVRSQFYNNIINLKEMKVDGKRVYRVTMTGFQNKDQVLKMKSDLKASGFKSYIFDN